MNDRQLKQDLTNYLDAALQSLITGAAEDIAAYAQDIATGIVIASNQPDPEKRDRLLAEITAQGRALAEKQRIRANNAGWQAFEDGLALATGLAVRAIVAGAA